MKNIAAISILLLMVFVSANAQDQQIKKEIIGTWNYTADEAPYEYQKGKIIFYEEGGALKAKLDMKYNTMHAQKIEIEGREIVCTAYVEYELVTITLTLKDGKLDGNADTSEGKLPVTLVKENDKA